MGGDVCGWVGGGGGAIALVSTPFRRCFIFFFSLSFGLSFTFGGHAASLQGLALPPAPVPLSAAQLLCQQLLLLFEAVGGGAGRLCSGAHRLFRANQLSISGCGGWVGGRIVAGFCFSRGWLGVCVCVGGGVTCTRDRRHLSPGKKRFSC